jgi:hypothetical protein
MMRSAEVLTMLADIRDQCAADYQAIAAAEEEEDEDEDQAVKFHQKKKEGSLG